MNKAKEMARNMLKERLDINLIAKISGLTIEEIKSLTKSSNIDKYKGNT